MYKAVIIRLFPTREQQAKLFQSAGTARFVWNWALAFNQSYYEREKKTLSGYDLVREFTKLRRKKGYEWLRQISCEVGYNAINDLDKAYKAFFLRLKSGLSGGHPRFKAKGSTIPSFCLSSRRVYIDNDGKIYLMKIGHVKFKASVDLQGIRLYNTRIKFERGKWLLKCSIQQDEPASEPSLRDTAMGIDLGIKYFAVISCKGIKRVFKNINRSHKIRRLIRQLKHHQRSLSRKQKGSSNRLKQRAKVREIYGRLKRIRHDYIFRTAEAIIRMRPSVIMLETLNIPGMMKNKYIARAIAEQDWGLFKTVLERKAELSGIRIKYADQFFPSSKTCSNCGHIRDKLSLNERIYRRSECGIKIDRDYNAALNLEKLAYRCLVSKGKP